MVRLQQQGWIKGAWRKTENNREAKYYATLLRRPDKRPWLKKLSAGGEWLAWWTSFYASSAGFTITPPYVSQLMGSWSPSGTVFPPLPAPAMLDYQPRSRRRTFARAARRVRPERHNPNSIATLRIMIARLLIATTSLPVLWITARIVVGIYLDVLHATLGSMGSVRQGPSITSTLESWISERQRQIPSPLLGSGPLWVSPTLATRRAGCSPPQWAGVEPPPQPQAQGGELRPTDCSVAEPGTPISILDTV